MMSAFFRKTAEQRRNSFQIVGRERQVVVGGLGQQVLVRHIQETSFFPVAEVHHYEIRTAPTKLATHRARNVRLQQKFHLRSRRGDSSATSNISRSGRWRFKSSLV